MVAAGHEGAAAGHGVVTTGEEVVVAGYQLVDGGSGCGHSCCAASGCGARSRETAAL